MTNYVDELGWLTAREWQWYQDDSDRSLASFNERQSRGCQVNWPGSADNPWAHDDWPRGIRVGWAVEGHEVATKGTLDKTGATRWCPPSQSNELPWLPDPNSEVFRIWENYVHTIPTGEVSIRQWAEQRWANHTDPVAQAKRKLAKKQKLQQKQKILFCRREKPELRGQK